MRAGDRVQLHPGLDLWMRGAKFGEVVSVFHRGGVLKARVRLDLTGRIVSIPCDRLEVL